MKRLFTIAILLLAVGSAAYVLRDVVGGKTSTADAANALPRGDSAQLIVYYFDMGKDCSTCLNLESYTHQTLTTYFNDALQSGAIEWAVVDVDTPETSHFVEDFGLYTKSVVLARFDGETMTGYNNLSRIWELVYDKDAFMEYVRLQVEEARGATS
tara:strand:- start:1471 stop:1938 length:468 start_codon:yes stop_codon:yes gene_type:complete